MLLLLLLLVLLLLSLVVALHSLLNLLGGRRLRRLWLRGLLWLHLRLLRQL